MRGRGDAASSDHIHRAAQAGTSGPGGRLPHLDAIQRSFGPFDVSSVRAHTDERAAHSARSMGAEGFATGSDIAFRDATPTLHTAAHEAAHVIQQRGGIQLKGGVGEAGDTYERHADAVADLVVAGQSAVPVLAELAGSPDASAGASRAVQHQLTGEDQLTHITRKLYMAHAINQVQASGVRDPSAVQVLIFSGREGLIADLAPIRTNQRARTEMPTTPMSYVRDDHHGSERASASVSRDGEMFQLDAIREAVGGFIRARPGFHNGHVDEIRIEFIGPRGTCTDCEAALRTAVGVWQGVMNTEFGNGTITLSMNARWTSQQIEHGQRTNNNRDQSTTYGTTDAHASTGPKLGPTRVPAPHWKNEIA